MIKRGSGSLNLTQFHEHKGSYSLAGFIYIMSNPAFPNLVKIGKSKKDPTTDRVNELNQTGVPEPFKVEYYAFVTDENGLESHMHNKFADQRPNLKREFFSVDVSKATNAIQQSAKKFGGLKYEEIFHNGTVVSNNLLDQDWWEDDRLDPENYLTLDEIEREIEKCSDINQCNQNGRTALSWAVSHYRYWKRSRGKIHNNQQWPARKDIVKLLLDAGADPKVVDHDGGSPIHSATDAATIQTLVDAGADVNCQSEDGKTLLHQLVFYEEIEAIKTLIKAEIAINLTDGTGSTALHDAGRYGGPYQIVKLLLAHGASTTEIDNDGNTPLHLLTQCRQTIYNSKDLLDTLLDHGGDPYVTNNDGQSALDLARLNLFVKNSFNEELLNQFPD